MPADDPAGTADGTPGTADGTGGTAGCGAAPALAGLPTGLLRGALEAAWWVAREGVAASPPVEAPVPLRPMLGWARLPPRSLQVVRRAVEGDEEFRRRVAATVDPERLDPPARLWLLRPDGWEARLAAIAADAAGRRHAQEASRAERREERELRRHLQAAAAQLASAEAAAGAAAQRVAEASGEAALWRGRARQAEARIEVLEADLAASRSEATAVAARAERAEAAAGAAARAADQHRAALDEAAAAAAAAQARIARLEADLASARTSLDAGAARRSGAGVAVAEAAGAATALGAALARAAAALGVGHGAPPAGIAPGLPPPTHPLTAEDSAAAGDSAVAGDSRPPPSSGARAAAARRARALPPPAPARQAVAVPGGMFDDSAEWAGWLLRRPGILVLVDGYNVTLRSWPAADLAEQRRTLEAALGALAARTGAEVHVVFDASADEELPAPLGVARRPVKVSFSRTGEDADEVLIALVDATSAARPVVVVTDDRRLRAEVAARGANVLGVAQLHAVTDRR